MTAAERVARTQSRLRVVVILSALLWGGAILLAVLALELVAGAWKLGGAAHGWNWDGAVIIAALAACYVLWRARFVLSRRRVALWIEERAPSLQYALVTASDPLVTGNIQPLEAEIDRANLDVLIGPAVLTPAVYAGVALSVMAGAFAAALTFASGRPSTNLRMQLHDALGTAGVDTPLPNRLAPITVRVTLPAYAGGRVTELDDPSAVTALVGSSIVIHGAGDTAGIGARFPTSAIAVRSNDGGWQATFAMPSAPTTVSLSDRRYERVLAIIPVIDALPVVTLMQPSRDTVWRHVPASAIQFVAHATDDIGLANGHIEYTVTTGSGEVFKSRTSSIGVTQLKNATAADLRASLNPAQLGLTEGAILSVRAVASDNNTLGGAGTATSDTRTFRVARADEYDSLAVDGAPPPPMERSLLTERMLIVSAESLLKKRTVTAPHGYSVASGRIGADQAELRRRVYAILYEQAEAGGDQGVEGDDEELDPQLVLNHDLKDAYDAMWDAERSLNIGEIPAALPLMTRALHALDRARLADRLYIRGRSPRVIVNIEKVRLSGKDKGRANVVSAPRTRADTAGVAFNASLDAALGMSRSDPSRFIDELIRLRARATSVNAGFGNALGDAVDAFRHGRDMTPALVRARRALVGAPRAGDASLPWTGSWSVPRNRRQ